MSIYKRKRSPFYWVRIQVLGRKIEKSTGTADKAQAEEFEQRERTLLWREQRLGDRGSARFADVAQKWLKSTRKKEKSSDVGRLNWFLAQTGVADTPIRGFDDVAIDELRQLLIEGAPGTTVPVRTDGTPYRAPRGSTTVDRHMTVLRAILNKAKKLKLLAEVPHIPMFNVKPKARTWLTRDEFESLYRELPLHLQICARFAVLTGLRMSSMLKMTWDRIDLAQRHAWVPGEMMKGGEPFGFPLSNAAAKVLMQARSYAPSGNHVFQYEDKLRANLTNRQIKAVARELLRKHGTVGQRELRAALKEQYGQSGRTDRITRICREETLLLLERGSVARMNRLPPRAPVTVAARMRPIGNCYTEAFRSAVERAGIKKKVTWHTLRHTFASWAKQAGVADADIMELGNWKTEGTMRHYAHSSSGHLGRAAELIAGDTQTPARKRLSRGG